jgi:hypothetical protein
MTSWTYTARTLLAVLRWPFHPWLICGPFNEFCLRAAERVEAQDNYVAQQRADLLALKERVDKLEVQKSPH